MGLRGYLTRAEAAELLGVDPRSVSHYYRHCGLRGEEVGGNVFFRPADVRRFKRRPRGNPNFRRKRPPKHPAA